MSTYKVRAACVLYVGIDPGLGGAVAAINEQGEVITLQDTPTLMVKKSGKGHKRTYVESAMASILENCKGNVIGSGQILVTVENQHARPGMSAVSTFNTGVGYGLWRMACAALRIPYQFVEPGKWKKQRGLASGSDKNASIVLASRLFPSASLARKKDDGRAEALLIAEWAHRQRVK